MDCFHDFCLACDRQSSSGPYCSQACRMADLERASSTSSPPSSPTANSSTFQPSSPQNIRPSHHNATRYSNYSPRNVTFDPRNPRPTPFMLGSMRTSQYTMTPVSEPPQRSLTPSSSRSSLSSTTSQPSTATNPGVSDQAHRELEDYFHSFDKTRASRKRQWTW